MYTHVQVREVVADTPRCHRSKLLLVTPSSSAQREKRSDILNDLGFTRFAGDYD